MNLRTIITGLIAPASKAVAALIVPFVLVVLGWVAEKSGVPLDVDPEQVSTWVAAAVVAVFNAVVVYFVRNGIEADPTTSTPLL